MIEVSSPSGRVIRCHDEAEAERVRAWTQWVLAERYRREQSDAARVAAQQRADRERQRFGLADPFVYR